MPGTYDVSLVTGTYTVPADIDDQVILADATAAAFTITLPDAGQFAGKRLTIKRINAAANNVTIAAPTPAAFPTALAITNVTNTTNPTITTAVPHGLQPGQNITIAGVGGAVGVNATFTVLAVGASAAGGGSATTGSNNFTVTTTAPGVYTSGGTITAAQQLIDTASTLAITVNNSSVDLMSNGVNYYILVKSLAASTV